MKIDFKKFKKYTKIDKSDFVEIDVREMFADNIYNVTGVGIADLQKKFFPAMTIPNFQMMKLAG